MEELYRLKGKPFKGMESIIEVQIWIRSCERIFKCINISDEQKGFFTSWKLQDGALAWWESISLNDSEDGFS